MICWTCHWGWPVEVQAVFDKYLARLDGDELALEYGRGHIVWGDHNFGDSSIEWCLAQPAHQFKPDDDPIVIESLRELLTIPEAIRTYEPPGYDGQHPERYPPTIETTMKAQRMAEGKS